VLTGTDFTAAPGIDVRFDTVGEADATSNSEAPSKFDAVVRPLASVSTRSAALGDAISPTATKADAMRDTDSGIER
jgi:hypothetical protein